MEASKVKALVVVFVLFLLTGLVTGGCAGKQKSSWVNTSSMPGQTFANTTNEQKPARTAIVYLGNDRTPSRSSGFGPKDPSFDFDNLK